MAYEIEYDIADDFVAGLDELLLGEAIDADEGITTEFAGVRTHEGTCYCVFNSGPTAGEKTALDAIVAAHDIGVLWLSDFLVGHCCDHRLVDYKACLTSRLHKVISTIYRGEVRQVRYYDDTDCTNLVLQVDVVYIRNPVTALAISRLTIRTWYTKDGNPHAIKKTTLKVYDSVHQMQEGKRRRGNITDQLAVSVLSMIVATTAANPASPTAEEVAAAEATGVAYISKYTERLDHYVRTGDMSFKDTGTPNIEDDTEEFLDSIVTYYGWAGPTIRDEILNSIKGILE